MVPLCTLRPSTQQTLPRWRSPAAAHAAPVGRDAVAPMDPATTAGAVGVGSKRANVGAKSKGSSARQPEPYDTRTVPYGSVAVRPYGGPQPNVTVSLLAMLEEAVCVMATAFVGTMVGRCGVADGVYQHRAKQGGGTWAPLVGEGRGEARRHAVVKQ